MCCFYQKMKYTKLVYSILIRKYYNEKIERHIIQKHSNSGEIVGYLILAEYQFKGKIFEKNNVWNFGHNKKNLSLTKTAGNFY